MNTRNGFCRFFSYTPTAVLLALVLSFTANGRVLDDFNDNTKTGWTDFTFAPGAGSITEQNGQFRLEIPGAVPAAFGSIFCASTKTSEKVVLQEGRTVEFRVDIISGGGADSFAILGFIPDTSPNPGSLRGYSLAKSTTDALIAKGINQYFVDNNLDEGAPSRHENTTLVLSLSVKGGNVIINARILDKDANNAVLWERTVTDSPAVDPMEDGSESGGPEPFIGSGSFVLYLFADYSASSPEDPYRAHFDNAEVFVTESTVLDDFNDNTKTDWADFTFAPGAGSMTEQNGQFRFQIPGAVPAAFGALFCASTKTTPVVELKEGELVEFRVDVVDGGLKDSFAILSFVPTVANGPSTLKGYSFAKSITDVLIVKGINQYFVADDEVTAELQQTNITMVLSMLTRNGSVTLDARILDKGNNNAVLWHQTIVDTPAADVMADGTDNPAAPYIGTGNFVLMLYADYDRNAPEDPYFAIFDNAVLSAPPKAANAAPLIADVLPMDRANFLTAPAQISFKVTDDQPLNSAKVSVNLNGTNYTTANGLTVTGSGTSLNVSLGGLGVDKDYSATLRAEDSDGEATSRDLYFDTFSPSHLAIELENYNFGSGQFIDDVQIVPENVWMENAYSYQLGTLNVDYSDTRTGPAGFNNNPFRPDDYIRAAHSRDNVRAKYTAAGGADAGVFDYDIGDIATGEWLNYTHTFLPGNYEVYLRQSIANLPTAESVLEKVTSDRSQENQTTQLLGSFLGQLSGFTYRNFPLTDASGQNKVVLRLDGVTTLRLRQVTANTTDGERRQNYMIFIPVAEAGLQRATVSAVTPASGAIVTGVNPVLSATILNRDTTVNTSTIKLELDNQVVPATVTPSASGATVTHPLDPLPPSGKTYTAKVSFQDNQQTNVVTSWQFTLNYPSLDPALRVGGTGKDRGFNVRVVQAEPGSNTENSLAFAESMLRPTPAKPVLYQTNVFEQVVNFSQNGPGTADGSFVDDLLIPGLDPSYTDDIAMEVTAYLELPAGKYRFGAHCDDGYKVQVVPAFTATETPPLAFRNGGPANETYDFVVTAGGLYRFRMVWNERGGGAHVEWFQANFADGTRTLLNTASAVKAFRAIDAAAEFTGISVSNGQVTLTWTGSGALEESANLQTWTAVPGQPASPYSAPASATGGKYYRLRK